MLLAKIMEENRMLREVNDRYEEMLDLEREQVLRLREDNATIMARYIQVSGLLEDKTSAIRCESDDMECMAT
ncbi:MULTISPECIES: hypothetical protein [Prosthecochloris]|nr:MULTISPECIES: hypothetical protein [Prosthecochloris]